MQTKIRNILCVIFLFSLAGCMSVNVQEKLDGQKLSLVEENTAIAHMSYYNYGYYLFGCIPVVTGDPLEEGAMTFFDDTMSVKRGMKVIITKSKALGADKMLNLTSRREVFPTIFSLFTFSYVELQISCDVVKGSDKKFAKSLVPLEK
jgi:hypothetical protein